MYRVKRFKVFENERLFGVGDIDYIDNFAELFNIFSLLRSSEMCDKHGILKVDVDDIGSKYPEFDDMFDTEEEYYASLALVKEIIEKYYKRL